MKLASKAISLLSLFSLIMFDVTIAYAETDCENINHPATQDEYKACLRSDIAKKAVENGVDCIDCIFEQKDDSSSMIEALGILAQPLAYLAGTYVVNKYQHETQKKWADAYASGFEQCTNRFNSYLNYNTTIGANPISAAEANSFSASCNGYGYGSYAGYGGYMGNMYGGYSNPLLGAGYSSGFLSGYGGGYWGSTYNGGMGMYSGSIGIGTTSTSSSSVYSSGISTAFGF